MREKEAKARIKINKLLEESGWRFFDDKNGVANIQLEPNIKMTREQFDDLGDDFEKKEDGYVDFLLLDDKGNYFVVLEAKSENKDPLIGKEQARKYAKSLSVRFVILSNGNQHYLWNIQKGNPQLITVIPSYESLSQNKAMSKDTTKLCNEEINDDFIAIIKMPDYANAPEYKNIETRKKFIKDMDLRFLRKYQINALKSLQESVKKGNERFLFEMATGTGKTLTSVAVIKLFLRSGCAHRVLFLVDRLELENQAKKNFSNYLKPDYHTVVFKENTDDWRKAEIVVSTVQSLSFNGKYKNYFKPTDFDLIIADECHRSINGNARAVFEYFLGYKLGLTATPKDYIKNIDESELKTNDQRAWEKRQLIDTYKTFGCESGEPTFRYDLNDGVKDGFLVQPIVVDARTEITTKLLAEKGYAIVTNNDNDDGDNDEEQTFFARDFERKFFSEETNKIICETFMKNAMRDPISGEIGKGIIFCVSRKHAAKITQILNELADTDKYQSDFAMQITSDIPNAQIYTINFQNNNLSGKTTFLEDYNSSKTRICVTVGMMTTGYDCEDILNIGLLRPIFSPTDFIQIKGRGTRTYEFSYKTNVNGQREEYREVKPHFKLFDFFGNFEYFEEKFNYDEILKLPVKASERDSDPNTPPAVSDGIYENLSPDPLKSVVETKITLDGMKIDRMFFQRFEDKVKKDNRVYERYEQGNVALVKKYIDDTYMNKPTEYFTWEKLIKSINIDRNITIKEIIDKILGIIPYFKYKKELVKDEFDAFLLTNNIPSEKYYDVKRFFETYLTNKEVRQIIEDEKYPLLATCPAYTFFDLKELGPKYMKEIKEYIKDNINVSRFTS